MAQPDSEQSAERSAALKLLQQNLDAARARYVQRNPKSQSRFESACDAMPGGNTRSSLHFDPYPLTTTGGQGARLTDVDGHEYVDYLGDYTAGLFGHSHPLLLEAMQSAVGAGLTLGAPSTHESDLATTICDRFPAVERLRFTNSGTEANLMAVTAARAHTGRSHIMTFRYGYHGSVFIFKDEPSPNNAPYPVVLADYNDVDGTSALIDQHASDLAAVLIEPMQGTGGAIAADLPFLTMLREQCSRHGIVLIFDEVMTSRLSGGGLQLLTGVTPDMTSFGKYLGGGGSFGAFGGQTKIMDQFDPRSSSGIAHAGTFNANVLTMAAGVAGLRDVYTAEVADKHTERGERFKSAVNDTVATLGAPLQMIGVGSILHLHWQREPIHSVRDLHPADSRLAQWLHLLMLERNIYISQKGFITLALPLTEEDDKVFIEQLTDSLNEMAPVLRSFE
jgi:glutamate-1-semialdehyde 2,1-aminomutase